MMAAEIAVVSSIYFVRLLLLPHTERQIGQIIGLSRPVNREDHIRHREQVNLVTGSPLCPVLLQIVTQFHQVSQVSLGPYPPLCPPLVFYFKL